MLFKRILTFLLLNINDSNALELGMLKFKQEPYLQIMSILILNIDILKVLNILHNEANLLVFFLKVTKNIHSEVIDEITELTKTHQLELDTKDISTLCINRVCLDIINNMVKKQDVVFQLAALSKQILIKHFNIDLENKIITTTNNSLTVYFDVSLDGNKYTSFLFNMQRASFVRTSMHHVIYKLYVKSELNCLNRYRQREPDSEIMLSIINELYSYPSILTRHYPKYTNEDALNIYGLYNNIEITNGIRTLVQTINPPFKKLIEVLNIEIDDNHLEPIEF